MFTAPFDASLFWKPSVLTSAGFKENRVLFLAAARQGYDEDASVFCKLRRK